MNNKYSIGCDKADPKFLESTTAVIRELELDEELIEVEDPKNAESIIASFIVPKEEVKEEVKDES